MKFIIAIDGLAGTGKSSIARRIAEEFSLFYVDTGAIYRAVACIAIKNRLMLDDINAINNIAKNIKIDMQFIDGCFNIIVNDEDITKEIRSEEISQCSSIISKYANVRQSLLSLQRQLGLSSNIGSIVEGRDIGTVVFPDANIKLFLTASPHARAQRRFAELTAKGENISFHEVLESLIKRDNRDQTRSIAPTIAARDAIIIDTTDYSEQEVVNKVANIIIDYQKSHRAGF
jgi:CMP/dCMP kinase